MPPAAFTIVATAIGGVGVLWTERGLAGVAIPDRNDAATLARLARIRPSAVAGSPDGAIAVAIDGMVALLRGDVVDFQGTRFDLEGTTEFERRVYEVALAIPTGRMLTYGVLATRIGDPGAARAVGAALGRNPIPIIIPCHRVHAANGRSGGFSAPGGADTKRRLLAIEGAAIGDQPDLFSELGRHLPTSVS